MWYDVVKVIDTAHLVLRGIDQIDQMLILKWDKMAIGCQFDLVGWVGFTWGRDGHDGHYGTMRERG